MLIDNEELLRVAVKQLNISYSPSAKIPYFKDLHHDGDLIHYIRQNMSQKNMKEYSDILHGAGYRTCLDVLEEYIDFLNQDDISSVDDLVVGEKYSVYQIAALIKNYDIYKGMKFVETPEREFVVIKSTLEDSNSEQGYHDHWIEEGKILCYYGEREGEDPDKLRNFTYRKTPNRKIFDSIINNATESLDIYVFTREIDSGPFVYQGIYHAIAPIEGINAFKLGNASISENDTAVKTVVADFEHDWQNKPTEEIVSRKAILKQKEPTATTIASKQNSDNNEVHFSERDYIHEAIRNEKIGDIGEEAVLKYEKEKIKDSLPNDPELAEDLIKQVSRVSLEPGGERYGYDIRSFDIVNGKAVPIFIEVKTTTSLKGENDFYITQHELETARSEQINRNYYIYRVYNINSDEPLFYKRKGAPENFFRLTPFIWLAKVK